MVRALDLWRRESWSTRVLLTIGLLLAVLAVLSAVLVVVVGALGGEWRWGELLDDITQVWLVGLGFGYVHWRRRALDAEKPHATRDYSVNFTGKPRLADIQRWREQQSERLGFDL